MAKNKINKTKTNNSLDTQDAKGETTLFDSQSGQEEKVQVAAKGAPVDTDTGTDKEDQKDEGSIKHMPGPGETKRDIKNIPFEVVYANDTDNQLVGSDMPVSNEVIQNTPTVDSNESENSNESEVGLHVDDMGAQAIAENQPSKNSDGIENEKGIGSGETPGNARVDNTEHHVPSVNQEAIEHQPYSGENNQEPDISLNPFSEDEGTEIDSSQNLPEHTERANVEDERVLVGSTEMGKELEAPFNSGGNQTQNGAQYDRIFSADLPVFFEIHKGNIYHYFTSAIIAPSKYYNNRAFPDLQSLDPDNLLLANTASLADDEEIILLSLELSGEEISRLAVDGSVAVMNFPVPITRVVGIWVKANSVKESILNDSSLFNGGFIPDELIKVNFPPVAERLQLSSASIKEVAKEYRSKVDKFDRVLGLFAFLRNYSYLTSVRTGVYKSLPDHFFLAMQALQPEFGSRVISNSNLSEFYAFLFAENCPSDKVLLKWLFDRLQVPENFNDQDTLDFFDTFGRLREETIPKDKVRAVFTSLRDSLTRKLTLNLIDGLKSKSTSILPIYIFAYLRIYGNLNSIDIARRDISTYQSNAYGEYAFALLGYFYGYTALKNSDERQTQFSDAAALSGRVIAKPAIKFKIDNLFDRSVIDLVFNNVFGLERLGDMALAGKNLEDTHKVSNDKKTEVALSTFNILDYTYEYIKVKSLVPDKVDLIAVIRESSAEIAFHSELGYLCQKLRMVPSFTELSAKNLYTTGVAALLSNAKFSKAQLIERLNEQSSVITAEELEIRILLARKSKEI